jgi:hypothetical protein
MCPVDATFVGADCRLTMRCSVRRLSSRRLQGLQARSNGLVQQAARRLRAAADRGR